MGKVAHFIVQRRKPRGMTHPSPLVERGDGLRPQRLAAIARTERTGTLLSSAAITATTISPP